MSQSPGAAASPLVKTIARSCSVAAQIAVEKLAHYRARTPADIPASSRSITTEWLSAVLCANVPGAQVTSFELRGGSRGTSTRWAMSVSYNRPGRDAGRPTELFAKTTTALSQRLILGLAYVIGGEIGFYRDIRPEININTPVGYFAGVDDRSWQSIVLIEDIGRTRGATFSTPTTAVSQQNMEQMLGDMAAYHAHFWNDPRLPRYGSWLKTPRKHLDNISQFIGMRERSAVGLKRASTVVPGELDGQYERLWLGLERSLELASHARTTAAIVDLASFEAIGV
jgi:hypothetical protein